MRSIRHEGGTARCRYRGRAIENRPSLRLSTGGRFFALRPSVPPEFLDPQLPVLKTHSRLPHWQQDGKTYFVTFRLADALPLFLLRDYQAERKQWMAVHPEPWSVEVQRECHERFSVRMDRWLDEGHGESLLKNPDAAEIVAEALTYFDGSRCTQHAWVIMPNHVHAVFSLLEDWPLDSLLRSWKRTSARRLNMIFGREGAFWQKDYFDRMIRDAEHFENVIGYIRRNPIKARLRTGEFLFWERGT